MHEIKFKIGQQIFHIGPSGVMGWQPAAGPGRYFFDEIEVRQVEEMIPTWQAGQRAYAIRALERALESMPQNVLYRVAIDRLRNPRRIQARKRPASAGLEYHSFSRQWYERQERNKQKRSIGNGRIMHKSQLQRDVWGVLPLD